MTVQHYFIALISVIGSMFSSALVVYVAYRKLKPELKKLGSEVEVNNAEASTSWATSNKMAVDQLILFQQEIATMRSIRIISDIKIADLDVRIAVLEQRIKRLEAQLVSQGLEPIK